MKLIVAALDEAYITGVERYSLGDLIRDVLERWPEEKARYRAANPQKRTEIRRSLSRVSDHDLTK